MPSQITSLRLLLNHPPSFLSPLSPPAPLSPLVSRFSKGTRPQPFLLLRPISVLTVNSSSYRSGGRPRNIPFSPKFTFESKGNSSLSVDTKTQPIEKEKPDSSMAGPEVPGFNKRRAEGRDKNDKPKTLEKKIRKLNPVNTICYAQILGTGMDTQDTSSSVLLFFDKQRFIFNAGEGLQRFCTEHKIKLSKIDHIFLSRVCSETAGGLPGLLLTLASIGDVGMSVNIWGPSDLQLMIDAMKSFIPNAAMVHTRSFGPLNQREQGLLTSDQNFSEPIVLVDDEVVKLSAILLRTSYTVSGGGNSFPESFGSDGNNMASLKPGDLSVVYICELPEIKGKFDPQKAKALGLRAGPKYRELQLGNPVKSDTQDIMVHPNDVMDPSIPGPIVLLVDCPTESHLRYLSSVSSLNSYYAGFSSETGKKVNCVIHLSPSSVMNNPDYQLWMRKFGSTQHIMAGHEAENAKIPILKSSAKVAARLNYLCPKFFPASGFLPVEYINGSAQSCNTSSEEHQRIAAENLLKFHLRPYAQLGLDTSCIPVSNPHREIINQLLQEIPEVEIAADQVRKLWCDTVDSKENVIASLDTKNTMIDEPCLNENGVPNCLENISREDLEIVLLGTGSSQPSKYRNVSSIYINLFSKGSLLLDCGEGTLGQLKRRYGLEGADDAIRSLRCIWISHIHADHHTGLARILALRRELLKNTLHEPLLVVGPRQLKRFLDAYQRLENLDMQFLDCKHTTQASLDAVMMSEFSTNQSSTSRSPDSTQVNLDESVFAKGSSMQSIFKRPGSPVDHSVALPILQNLMKVLKEAGLGSLISFPVVHCPQAFGVALKASDRVNSVGKIIPGWKIVYSGDTRPCPELIKASRGATILIHEATFEDGMVDEAVARNHSTTSEAIEVGESAGAYRIILTHFSQRYPKIPVFDGTHMHNTCIGFDLMSINIADLHVLPQVLPYLKLLFRDEMLIEEESVDDLAEEVVRAAL